jgi:hypothetical protein
MRKHLPFRKNCEGYFTKGNLILARQSKHGLIFPGGGIDAGESIQDGMLRETMEETGATISNLTKMGEMKIEWGQDWAKTPKQKTRYQQYQGDEMHFFHGQIAKLGQAHGDSQNSSETDAWGINKLMHQAIQILEGQIPSIGNKSYHAFQLNVLNKIALKKGKTKSKTI